MKTLGQLCLLSAFSDSNSFMTLSLGLVLDNTYGKHSDSSLYVYIDCIKNYTFVCSNTNCYACNH